MMQVENQAIKEIQQTPVWQLFEKGRNYHRLTGIYTDTDRNYRFYNDDQWSGAKLGDVEPVQKNFIKPIVKYKVAIIHDNLYAIVYSSQNYANREFQRMAGRYCDLCNRYASRVWEQEKMDFKGRRVTKDAAINSEGIIFVDFDEEKMMPINEVIDKVDVYYGNENSDDIQSQPYILIRRRMPVANAIEFALAEGVSQEKIPFIIGDNDNFEQAGDASKQELDNMVTVVYKMYRKDGTVHFSIATRWVEILEDADTGLHLYPIAHFIWEEKKGSSRGEGEVRLLIPNQIEVNRTEMRRVITVKQQAYPKMVADTGRISNPNALSRVGAVIRAKGQTVDDVHKIVATLPPAQMSPDVKQLQDDLINVTRDLAGAGEVATGQTDPESASGRAILAVQQASQTPMTEQRESYKNFVEDIARIWLEYLTVYSRDGVDMEEAVTDPQTGEEIIQVVHVPQTVFEELKADVKIDITPRSVYDRFAREQTLENMFIQGMFNAQRLSELEIYVRLLPDDSVAPKAELEKAVRYMRDEQKRIAQIQMQAQLMEQRAQMFLMGGPEEQASMMADARMQLQQQGQRKPIEEDVDEAEEKTGAEEEALPEPEAPEE